MNKIGLLTFHKTTNFGSLLQTYGLYHQIESMGFEPEIIDYQSPALNKAENLQVTWSIKNPKQILKNILFQPVLNRKARKFSCFSTSHMRISKEYTPETINKAEKNYSKIIVGSDIVWGRDITNDDYVYFLDFVKDKRKKFAFASSVGDCYIREDETKLEYLLKQFSKIAVREEEAVQWVQNISGVEAEWVCDPTMLLTSQEWRSIIPLKKYKSNYVLVYFDDPKHKCLTDAIRYAKLHHKKVVFIKYGIPVKNTRSIQPTSIEEFLGLIDSADAVFTASYHGMLFSMYFHKQFKYYLRAHSSRMSSLANLIGVEHLCGTYEISGEIPFIDYDNVDKNIEVFRRKSITILEEMLRDGAEE